ncbi:MAG: hypothetical protein V3U02_12585 [Calditrichia bacterium]
MAAELYRDFTGHDPEYIDNVTVDTPDVGFKIGSCDGILYTTTRDGKKESYIHRFSNRSKPALVSSFDGSQLYILGKGYKFTDRGIVDK